jgi:hypothetical protein
MSLINNIYQSVRETMKTINDFFDQLKTLAFNRLSRSIAFVFNRLEKELTLVESGIRDVYTNIAQYVPRSIQHFLLAIGNRLETTVKFMNMIASSIQKSTANLVFETGERTYEVSHDIGTAIIKVGYLFVQEPTTIYDVRLVILSPTSAKVSWKTNHPANGKVNYGLDETYSLDVQNEKRTNDHEFTLTGLEPNTQYHFEVMSQNRNYVYDANRKFTTPTE